ncbi:hypothetical protein GOM49_13005 [Clostridium bovifaecis]|uniref:Uncharacterized protein n=1 Tax=Clostridium bovifaecis TaxID=2184719 RepID=A0A6I6F6B5_9CLOT|nr:hypothetical protein GOM49_13005 [Clostridium bovifaecis]
MLKKMLIKFKDGDILLHNCSGNKELDLSMLKTMLENNIPEDNEDENSNIHSIEIILA